MVLTFKEHSLICAPNCLRLYALALEQDDILEIDISIAVFAAAQEVERILKVGVVGVDTLTRIGCEQNHQVLSCDLTSLRCRGLRSSIIAHGSNVVTCPATVHHQNYIDAFALSQFLRKKLCLEHEFRLSACIHQRRGPVIVSCPVSGKGDKDDS